MDTKTTSFRLSGTDVILYDYEPGKGKIILSNDDFDYNLSYFWGSMGEGYNLSEFIKEISTGYFVGKLGQRDDAGEINMKRTMAAVRKFIKEETSWKWYYNIAADKNLREKLWNVQNFSGCHNEFVQLMMDLDVDYPTERKYCTYESDFVDMVKSISCEPWYFIVRNPPSVNVWLKNFHSILVKHLKKELTHEH